nr:uncharacterized protein LOC111427705 [Onthophagus taurus]
MLEGIYDVDEIKILDGGFGTQIAKHIDKSLDDDALWSARLLTTNKEAVIETHLDFLRAGSNIIGTNTYQASVEGFKNHLKLSKEESLNLIREAVGLAKTARDNYILENPYCKLPLIAGSVGPYGASLHDGSEYTGTYRDTISKEILKEYHNGRIEALIDGGVDLLAFETIPCKIEAEVLLELLKEYPDIKAWLSFNCKNGTCLASGENFKETVLYCYNLNPDQLVAIGTNCVSPVFVEELLSEVHSDKSIAIPLIVYANSGEDYSKEKGWFGRENCLKPADYVSKWLDLGVKWIGGCCRVYDSDISAIRVEVEKYSKKK